MKLQIVAIRDRALGAYMRPAFVPSLGVALRGFTDEVNRKDSEIAAHPDDYDLYHFGEFDDEAGQFASIEPEQIAMGKQVLIKE